VKISQAKIGFTVIAKNAHEFIAAKVSNSSGDARQYLDLVEKAVIFCKRKLSLEKLDNDHSKPIVAIRDAMKAISETNHKSRDIIRSLTSTEKMTLCAGVHLARKLGGKPVELGKLRTLTMMAYGLDSDLSLEDFKGVIERLQDNGLLKLNEKEKQAFTKTGMCSLLRYPVQFDLQLEDVDSALEDTLMKEEFYKNMVERLRNAAV
jgi:Cdc6-like AAA superfamily ATPase